MAANAPQRPPDINNQLLLAALQAAAEGVVLTDSDGTIQWANEAFTRLTGYSAEEVIGKHPSIFKSGRHSQEYFAEMWRTVLSGANWHGTVINCRKDGSLYTEELSITPICGTEGNVTNFVAMKRDVTAREDLAERLKQSERQYRELFEGSPVAYYEADRDGLIRRINRAGCSLLGYESRDVVGRPIWDFVPGSDRSMVRESVLSSVAGSSETRLPVLRRAYLRPDGTLVPADIHRRLEYAPDGHITGVLVASIDVTEQTSVQAALTESNIRYEGLFRNSLDAIFLMSVRPDGSFVVEDVNPAWQEIVGLTRAQVIGKCPEEILLPRDAAAVIQRYRTGLETGQPQSYEETLEFPTRIGHFQTQLVPIRNAAGEIVRLAGFARDLTERLRMEADLRAKEEQLRLVLEANRDGFWDWDVPSGNMELSARVAEMLGYEPGEVENHIRRFTSLIPPDEFLAAQAVIRDHFSGNRSNFAIEHRMLRKDGTWTWVSSRGKVVSRNVEGAPLRAVGTLTDITDRKEAEEELRDREEHIRSVVAALAEGIVLQDAEGQILECNAAAQRILRVSEEDLRGCSFADPRWQAIREDGTEFPVDDHPSLQTLRTGRPCLGVVLGLPTIRGAPVPKV
jgi:PAS domain S-box-containing protein